MGSKVKVRKQIFHSETEWKEIPKEIAEGLRIVDDDLWEEVARIRWACEQRVKGVERRYTKYLLSGIIKCERCGGAFGVTEQNWFGCMNYKNRRTCDNKTRLKANMVEKIVLDYILGRILTPDHLEYIVSEVNRLLRERLSSSNERPKLLDEKQAIEQQMKNLVEAIKRGIAVDLIEKEYRSLGTKLREIETALESLPNEVIGPVHVGRAEILSRLEHVRELLVKTPKLSHATLRKVIKWLHVRRIGGSNQRPEYAFWGKGSIPGLLEVIKSGISSVALTGIEPVFQP